VFDIFCPTCEYEIENVVCEGGQFGKCDVCKGDMKMRPFVFATDVCGVRVDSDILDISWTSTREREAKMKARGFEPAGDAVRGARNEDHLHLGKRFSYAGQTGRG
jgi:hypothetical protein